MEQNYISQAIAIVGLPRLSKCLGVTYQAIRKWDSKNQLPRTEWTNETQYASMIESVTNGEISKRDLLNFCARKINTAPPDKESA
jgi:DNA-binding transcriptional regulator YdaS (Cro superfamily)